MRCRSATTKARKPRQRRTHVRTAKVLCGPSVGNPRTFVRITQDGELFHYWVEPVAADFGTAFRLEKPSAAEGEEAAYDVLLAPEGDSCTCKGITYGGYCKHVDSVRALRQAGKL